VDEEEEGSEYPDGHDSEDGGDSGRIPPRKRAQLA